jgi:hypothetical protein
LFPGVLDVDISIDIIVRILSDLFGSVKCKTFEGNTTICPSLVGGSAIQVLLVVESPIGDIN